MVLTRLQSLLQIESEESNDPFTLYAIALEYQKFDIENSILYFEKLLSLFPDYISTYYQYGNLLKAENDIPNAEIIFKKGLEIAISKKDYHTLAELKQALNRLLGLDFEDD